ncbi:MAG: hypothetical protein P4L50_03365 [Anaerolineaceae bacterium]|nr:hypothetical protein [Anaerolineaceae bacterium]
MHTPGPWKVYVSSSKTILVVTDNHRGAIICDFDPHNRDDNASNAQLIAAAPDLLAACETLVEWFKMAGLVYDEDGEENPELVQAVRAINKAKQAHA